MRNARFGIYEKALPPLSGWSKKLDIAARAGYAFVELSVDDDPRRLDRLKWTADQRAVLRDASAYSGVRVQTIVLSAHRKYPLGSRDPATGKRAVELLVQAVDLAVDIGARTIQIAGYYAYDEERDAGTRDRFITNLSRGLEPASQANVMLGLETMDGENVTSVESAMQIISEVNSPWLQVYPDVGNLAANGLDVSEELRLGAGRIVGVHLKDTRPGEYRRVPFGEGIVPFSEVFQALNETGYQGGYLVEMWNDGALDAFDTIINARVWLEAQMSEAKEVKTNAA